MRLFTINQKASSDVTTKIKNRENVISTGKVCLQRFTLTFHHRDRDQDQDVADSPEDDQAGVDDDHGVVDQPRDRPVLEVPLVELGVQTTLVVMARV